MVPLPKKLLENKQKKKKKKKQENPRLKIFMHGSGGGV